LKLFKIIIMIADFVIDTFAAKIDGRYFIISSSVYVHSLCDKFGIDHSTSQLNWFSNIQYLYYLPKFPSVIVYEHRSAVIYQFTVSAS
jgi:hypothetical protein